jgi:nucleotide-binding universal stress UspA family protein
MKYDKILLLADDSPLSLKAIKFGYQLAADLKAKVALLHVIDEALAMGNVDAGIFPEQAMAKMKTHADALLTRIVVDYGNGIETEILIRAGVVKNVVMATAKELDAKMIIMGTHGRKGLDRLLLGSLTESVLRRSTIPVLVVPME